MTPMRAGYMAFALTLLIGGQAALADGILVPPLRPEIPHFTIKYHHVKSQIKDQVATTEVDQVFVNETRSELEATYLFPLPPGAQVRDFTLIVDGKKMAGEILPRDKAVKLYEEIVRKRKDPGLLEYTGRDTYKARVYPIPARGQVRVQIEYTEVLPYDNGLVAYNYPMSTEKFSKEPIEETVFEARIESSRKLGAIYSPTHEIDVSREGKSFARVSYEEKRSKPDRDLLLYYSVGEDEVGTSVMTFKERGEDGFFLLLAAPAQEEVPAGRAVPKNVIFVLDRSGSMRSDDKIDQARAALKYCVESLNPDDRFEIITFATGVTAFGDGLQPAGKDQVARARKFISDIEASGGTDIDSALQLALKARKRSAPNYIAFLSDGLPTVGDVTDPEELIKLTRKRVEQMEDTPTRIFNFGVGYDVDTHFLDKLAEDNRGVTTYVRPQEDIEVKVSNWYRKIAQPILTDLSLDFGEIETFDLFPRVLPDIFAGSQLTLMGRYKKQATGETTISLSGQAGEAGKRTFRTKASFPGRSEGTDYIAALWAGRKIGYLLDQIRLHGKDKELVEEIVALSTKYGILTEYTAFLAQEDEAPRPIAEAREMAGMGMGAAFGGARAGAAPVSQSQNAQQMRDNVSVAAQNKYVDAEGRMQEVGNLQNRGQRGVVKRQGQWQDLRYDPAQHRIAFKVQAYSEAHFQLTRAFPELNQIMALSDNMLLIVNGHGVQIGADGKTELTDEDLKALGAAQPAAGTAVPEPEEGVAEARPERLTIGRALLCFLHNTLRQAIAAV